MVGKLVGHCGTQCTSFREFIRCTHLATAMFSNFFSDFQIPYFPSSISGVYVVSLPHRENGLDISEWSRAKFGWAVLLAGHDKKLTHQVFTFFLPCAAMATRQSAMASSKEMVS